MKEFTEKHHAFIAASFYKELVGITENRESRFLSWQHSVMLNKEVPEWLKEQ